MERRMPRRRRRTLASAVRAEFQKPYSSELASLIHFERPKRWGIRAKNRQKGDKWIQGGGGRGDGGQQGVATKTTKS